MPRSISNHEQYMKALEELYALMELDINATREENERREQLLFTISEWEAIHSKNLNEF